MYAKCYTSEMVNRVTYKAVRFSVVTDFPVNTLSRGFTVMHVLTRFMKGHHRFSSLLSVTLNWESLLYLK